MPVHCKFTFFRTNNQGLLHFSERMSLFFFCLFFYGIYPSGKSAAPFLPVNVFFDNLPLIISEAGRIDCLPIYKVIKITY